MNDREGKPGGDGARRQPYWKRSIKLGGPPRIETGVNGLDDILNGGLPQGHLYLLEGDPGTGKTTARCNSC